jgi:hypothetical protein
LSLAEGSLWLPQGNASTLVGQRGINTMTLLELDQVRKLTSLLRSGDEPFWSRLRSLLRERGVSPDEAALAECFPDGDSFEFGVVVATDRTDLFGVVVAVDRTVFQFGLSYLDGKIEDGTFSEWVDLTARFRSTPYRASIDAAVEFLNGEAPTTRK